jgi:hypothetical protein
MALRSASTMLSVVRARNGSNRSSGSVKTIVEFWWHRAPAGSARSAAADAGAELAIANVTASPRCSTKRAHAVRASLAARTGVPGMS